MVFGSATHGQERAYAPGIVVRNRGRSWRVDGQEEDVLIARVRMDRWELAKAPVTTGRGRPEKSRGAQHLLLLTATPHNGYADSFASLLRKLDVGGHRRPDPNAPDSPA